MATKQALIRQVGKNSITFAGKTDSKHWLMMDGPESFGGSDAGIRAKELLLLALGGCTGGDIASILAKKRIILDEFEVRITAEEAEEHPKVYTAMHVEYVFHGKNLSVADVERAIELSLNKYCGVTAMFRKAMSVTHSYRIVETE